MDLGVPYKYLGQMDLSGLAAKVAALSIDDWEERPVRRASLAGAPHTAARSLVMKHEWTPAASRRGFETLQQSIAFWCEKKGRDPADMFPLSVRRSSETPVYTFRDWDIWKDDVQPAIDAVADKLAPGGDPIISRIALVRLEGKGVVPYHVDEQPLAEKSHRVHVCLSRSPGCIYKIGGHHFTMQPGGMYDFNNRWKHGVENRDDTPRLNLMLEVLPGANWLGEEEVFG